MCQSTVDRQYGMSNEVMGTMSIYGGADLSWLQVVVLPLPACLDPTTPPWFVKSCCDPCKALCPCLTEQVFGTFDTLFACLHDQYCCAYCEQAYHFCERAKHLHWKGPSCVHAPSCVCHSTAHRVQTESSLLRSFRVRPTGRFDTSAI